MSYSDIILLAFALSIDVCVVSFSYGLCLEGRHKRSAMTLALTTGLFHAIMPILGYYFTDLVKVFIQPYAKWVVFLILMYLGLTFIIDAIKEDSPKKLCLDIKSILLVAIATSIDVFSAGISLALTASPMRFSVITMGCMTFANSLVGYYAGYCSKVFKSRYLELCGGLILICLAVKSIVY